MVRGAALALVTALTWMCAVRASVLVPTYVLPPDSFARDQRSLATPDSDVADTRTIKRLIGGHMKNKDQGSNKNSIIFGDKSKSGKFQNSIAPDQSGGTVGWNQGIWDDGMLMSSAGEGKDAGKIKEVDEDKKTLSDQVAEGKYGLIQNEIFPKTPKRPGIISYGTNSETRSKDNLQSLGGLKKDEIWLAEDNLLVLKGGSFPERTKESDQRPWPAIDDYVAPRRQVKLPQKPMVPPPFPVQLTDDGPLVFLTSNGSIPAPIFPPFAAGASDGPIPYPPFPYPPGAAYAPGEDQRNSTAGGAALPNPPFPFLPGNASEGQFPILPPMNGSFPEGFPPGAAFLPPPSNQSDLYDEDDPSIYYPPPYNFSYRTDYNNSVPAGPLVPGIILPPPPDFFAPMEESTTEATHTTSSKPPSTTHIRYKPSTKSSTKPPTTTSVYRHKYKPRPTTTVATEDPRTITTLSPADVVTTAKPRKPSRIVQIPARNPVRVHNSPNDVITRPKVEKPVYKTRTKTTSKPPSVSVIYDYQEPIRENSPPSTSAKPITGYNLPQNANEFVTSTPVPLRAYYSNMQNDNIPTTKLQPVYVKPKERPVTSFYFYEEEPRTASPASFFDGKNYFKTVPVQDSYSPPQNLNPQSGFSPSVDVAYGSIDQADAFFLWPQKQGPRTLTQEYFSIQKPQPQVYLQQQPAKRPDPFYQQIADIQQTIDLYANKKPKAHTQRAPNHKPKAITSRPVYQFSYQTKRPDHFSFRAPKLDPEPFRPMVSYSKPFNLENEFNAITPSVSTAYHQQYLIENVQVTTETPTSTKYYQKTRAREGEYINIPAQKNIRQQSNLIPIQSEKPTHQGRVQTTASPLSHGYYTKQDEKYLDDITKTSFDIFGKKIEDNNNFNTLAVTPSLDTVRTPINNGINLQYDYETFEPQNPSLPTLEKDTLVNNRFPRPPINPNSEPIQVNGHLVQTPKPPSLAEDTLVNDRLPRPPIHPDSEFIPIANPGYRTSQQYRIQTQTRRPQFAGEQYHLNRPSLAGDTAVNYKRPLPPINPDAEWITPINSAGEGQPGSFVSYRLPGDGAHVYFLTPQAVQAARERYRSPGYGR